MASVQKQTNSAITLKGSTEIVADFFGNKHKAADVCDLVLVAD